MIPNNRRTMTALAALFSLAIVGCGTEPIPLLVEIRNDWDAADRFTVEVEGAPLVEDVPVGARESKRAPTDAEVRPGDSLTLRLVRHDGGDATFSRTVTVPEVLGQEGAVVVFHLATDKSNPACPVGRTTCVLWSWSGQTTPPELF